MAPIDTTRLLTIQQAAHRLGVSVSTVRRLALPSLRIGDRSRRYDPADIETFIAQTKRIPA